MNNLFHCPRCRVDAQTERLDTRGDVHRCSQCRRMFHPIYYFDPADTQSILAQGAPRHCSATEADDGITLRLPAARTAYKFGALCMGTFFVILPVPFMTMIFLNDPWVSPIFTALYAVVFGIVAILSIPAMAWMLFGWTEIHLRSDGGAVVHGCGPIKRRARFNLDGACSVRIVDRRIGSHNDTSYSARCVEIKSNFGRFQIGAYSDDKTRRWIAAVLHDRLTSAKP